MGSLRAKKGNLRYVESPNVWWLHKPGFECGGLPGRLLPHRGSRKTAVDWPSGDHGASTKDIIIQEPENLSVLEIEGVIHSLPGVLEAAVLVGSRRSSRTKKGWRER